MVDGSAMLLKGVLLSLPLLFSIVSTSNRATYSSFLKDHLDPNRKNINPHKYCENIMRERNMTTSRCMESNTFIHATKAEVKSICGPGGLSYDYICYDSVYSFFITTCSLEGGSPPNACRYKGHSERRRIQVSCARGVPVDFQSILFGGEIGDTCDSDDYNFLDYE